jgi:cytochrome c553
MASFPRLAGQHEEYLLHALQAYRNGARGNPIMQAQVASLTPGEMADLAAYFASRKGLETKR